jgi:hypothetical protein
VSAAAGVPAVMLANNEIVSVGNAGKNSWACCRRHLTNVPQASPLQTRLHARYPVNPNRVI